ncbi:hypothetical protein P8F81_23595 (plasmid) [Kosakonia cowanii]|uniref:hypothetical protein n=1 Tax=Kosakonia cowanii TaxID=208223 RepID=UPI002DDD91A4|nr:hypothetical protein [Kosakonia cowanii]WRY61824.1 hypothetical protein P8F81_23595 [Kosakonia cowanii]
MRILFLVGMTVIAAFSLLQLQAAGADVNFQRPLIMSGIFIAGYALLYYFGERKGKKTKQWRYGTPVEETKNETLTDLSTAIYLWQEGGLSSMLRMLESLERALDEAGYALTRATGQLPGILAMRSMPSADRQQIAAALVRDRERHWAPKQTAEMVEDAVRQSQKTGYGEIMLKDLLESLRKRGWRLQRVAIPEKSAAPMFWQLILDVEADEGVPYVSISRALGRIGSTWREDRSLFSVEQQTVTGGFEHNGIAGNDASPVRWSATTRLCNDGAGFFPQTGMMVLPPALLEIKDAAPAPGRFVARIIVQGTAQDDRGTMANLLQKAIFKMNCGSAEDVEVNGDAGYGFTAHVPETMYKTA